MESEGKTCGTCGWTQIGVYKMNVEGAQGTEVCECHCNPPVFVMSVSGMPTRGWPAVFHQDKACTLWKRKEAVKHGGEESSGEEGPGQESSG